MSLFDFLTQDPTGGQGFGPATQPVQPQVAEQAPAMPQTAQAPAGGLLQAPAQTAQGPGLLERLRTPDDTGISTLDKIGAAAAMLRDNAEPDVGYKILDSKRKAFQSAKDTAAAQALKEKGNRAFRAAYQNGKFDASTYASVMGDDLDPMAFAKLATAAGPKGGESGGFALTTNPLNGQVEWHGQRPPSYADTTSFRTEAEREQHDRTTEAQGAGHLAVAQGNAALAKQREGRLASKPAAGGASWLPPGAKIVHLPGS